MLTLTPENWQDLRKFARFLSPYRSRILLAAGTMIASVLIQLPLPFVTMVVVDRVVKDRQLSIIPVFCAGILALSIFAALVALAHTLLLALLREHVLGTFEMRVVERIQHARMAFFYRNSSGYLSSRIRSDLRNLNSILAGSLLSATQSVLFLFCGIISLFILSWRLALVTVTFLPLFALATTAFNRELRTLSQTVQESTARLGSRLQQTLANAALIKAFCAESHARQRIRSQLLELISAVLRQEVLGALMQRVAMVMTMVVPLLLLWVGAGELLAHRLSIGQYIAFQAFLSYIFPPLQGLLGQNVRAQTALIALRRLHDLLELPSEAGELRHVSLPRRHDVRLESVVFGYQDGSPVLTGLDFAVEEGESVAIVGPSGEGKTTLLRLLLRFHEPDRGRLLLGGVDARHLAIGAYRSNFAVVFQEPFLFDGTIEDNLRIGADGANERQLWAALEVACAREFVASLPHGYRTKIGEAGVALSAGQKMRIAVARALLRDAPIVLLDEATSALDEKTEQHVLENLRTYLRGRTAVFVSHHAAALQLADRVLFLHGGVVYDRPPHDARVLHAPLQMPAGPRLAAHRAST